MNSARWTNLMSRLGIASNLDTYKSVAAAYAQKHRHYHTGEHIGHCLQELDVTVEPVCYPGEVELAIWFHDVVYKTRASDNEQKSADWAVRFLAMNGIHSTVQGRICELIIATRHDGKAESGDARVLVDIDLSILGADPARYARFENEVRQEYKWVPGPMFRRSRASILQSFLDRDCIYLTTSFRDRLESQARENLRRALLTLTA